MNTSTQLDSRPCTFISSALIVLLLWISNSEFSQCVAQGSLTPPGAPAPTMKSLDQIEARTAITNTASQATISQSGSYYLTGNLTVSTGNGIVIAANGVTLDLNGFTITSTAPSATGFGILFSGYLSDVTVLHGHVRGGVTNNGSGIFSGPGFLHGIYGPSSKSIQISGVSVSGIMNNAIYLSQTDVTLVESAMVHTTGNYGIYANTIKSSVAMDCGNTAIYGNQIADCRGECVNNAIGVNANTAQNSYGSSSNAFGLYANSAQNCYGSSSNSVGLFASTAQNCYGYSLTANGLVATAAQGCYGNSGAGIGLVAGTANTCVGYRPGGTAIQATVANGCYANSGTNSITYKYNMP